MVILYVLTSVGDIWDISLGFSSASECLLLSIPSVSRKTLDRKSWIDWLISLGCSIWRASSDMRKRNATRCVPSLSWMLELERRADCLASSEDSSEFDNVE